MALNCNINCIVCNKPLKNLEADASNHPIEGTAFTTCGHYGSTVFDPMDGTHLEINICDPCLSAAGEKGNVLLGFPQPAPPRGPMMKWPLKEIDSLSIQTRGNDQ